MFRQSLCAGSGLFSLNLTYIRVSLFIAEMTDFLFFKDFLLFDNLDPRKIFLYIYHFCADSKLYTCRTAVRTPVSEGGIQSRTF